LFIKSDRAQTPSLNVTKELVCGPRFE